MINYVFDPSKTTLAHLACALGSSEIVSVLMRRGGNGSNSIWTQKDDEGKSSLWDGAGRERVRVYMVCSVLRRERGRGGRERERDHAGYRACHVKVTFCKDVCPLSPHLY